MKNLRKGVMVLLATLVLGLIAVGGIAPQAQAASWKTFKTSKKNDKPLYAPYKKAKTVRLTMQTTSGKATVTLKTSKIEKDIKTLTAALKKSANTKLSYKSDNKKYSVTLTVNKKKGTFVIKNGKKTVMKKSFKVAKYGSKKNTYVLTGSSQKMTLKLFTNKGVSFRLMKGKTTNWKKNTIARLGTSKNKTNVLVLSKVPGFKLTKAQYK